MRLPNVRLLGLLVQLSYKNFKRSKKEKIFFSVLAVLWLIIFTFLSSFNSVLFIVNANNVLHPNTHSDFDVSLTVNFPSLTSLFNLIHVIVSQPFLKSGNMSLSFTLNNVFLMNKTSNTSQIMFYSLERTTVQKSLSSIIPTGVYLINGSTYENVSYLEYDNATHSYQNTSLLNKLFSLTSSQNQSYTTFFYAINSRPVNTGPITIIWISWDTFLSLLTLEQTLSLNHHVSLTGSAQITFQCAEAHLQLNLATTSLQTVVTNLKNQSIQFIASIDSYLNSNFNFTATTTNPVYTFTYVQQVLTLYSAINSNTYLMYQILLIFLLFLLLLLIYLLSSYSMAEYSELQLNSLLQRVYHPMITIGCILGSQTFADVMIFFIGLIALSVNNLLNNQYFVNINTLFVLIGMFLLIKNLYMSILLIYSANTTVSSSFKSPISPVYALTISGVVLAFLIIFYQYFEQFGVDQIIIFYLGFQIIKMFVEWYLMILISYATFLFLKYVHAYVSIRYSLTYVLLLLSGSVYFIKQYKQKLLILALFITLLFINLSTMSYYTSITANYQNDTLFGKTMLTGQDPTTLVPTIQYIQNISHETPLCLTRFSIASLPLDLNGNMLTVLYSVYSNFSSAHTFLTQDILATLSHNQSIISSSLAESLGLRVSSSIIVEPNNQNTSFLNLTIGRILPVIPFIGIESPYWMLVPNQSTFAITDWFIFTHNVLNLNTTVQQSFVSKGISLKTSDNYQPLWVYPINFLDILSIETLLLYIVIIVFSSNVFLDFQKFSGAFQAFLSIKGANIRKTKTYLVIITAGVSFFVFIGLGLLFGLNLLLYLMLFQTENPFLSINNTLLVFGILSLTVALIQTFLSICSNFFIRSHEMSHDGTNIVM